MIKLIINKVGNSRINKQRLKKKLKGIDRVNVGCGLNLVKGWLNIGLFPNRRTRRYGRIKKAGNTYVLQLDLKDLKKDLSLYVPVLYGTLKKINNSYALHFDLTKDIPIQENTVRYIYTSHFIEHLTFEEGIAFLKRCYKVMTKGAVIRLSFPDLELWIEKYYGKDMDFFNRYYNTFWYLSPEVKLKTKGEIFMHQLYGTGHKWGYDFESIKDILERAGFCNITRKKSLESSIPDIDKLEPSTRGRLLESMYVEGEKL